jgi:hypothetical protein
MRFVARSGHRTVHTARFEVFIAVNKIAVVWDVTQCSGIEYTRIVMCMSGSRRGLGLDIGFTDHLRIVTITVSRNYINVMCMSGSRRGLGLDIGFTDHLRIVTITVSRNYINYHCN